MARGRKSKAKQQEELINGIFSFFGVGGFFTTFYFTNSIKISLIVAAILVAVIIVVLVFRHLKKMERLKKSGITDIDQMDGIQFEHYLSHLFSSQGYKVTVTRAIGDYGADLVIEKNDKKIVVQAKRYKKNIGIDAIQQVHSSKNYYGATEAWVITNSYYTKAAENLADSNSVRLIDREDLIEMILQMNPGTAPSPSQIMLDNPEESIICDRCGSSMVRRKSTKGEFYGCSSFPKCRNTKKIEI